MTKPAWLVFLPTPQDGAPSIQHCDSQAAAEAVVAAHPGATIAAGEVREAGLDDQGLRVLKFRFPLDTGGEVEFTTREMPVN